MESNTNNNTQLFKYVFTQDDISDAKEFEVRTAGTIDEPFFCAKDVCAVLGIEYYRDAVARLEPELRARFPLDTPGGRQEMTFVNEEGLYELICTCRKAIAKPFKKWVFSTVLPSIRRTGQYRLPSRIENNQAHINLVRSGAELLDFLGTLDDRARAMISSTTLNLISLEQTEAKEEEEYSISRRVQERYHKNLCTKKHKSLLCQLGKAMAAHYRRIRGRQPKTRSQYVDGTLREVNCYSLQDFEEFGDAILECYLRND
jgi:prophage antirepressor-like protein